MLVLYSLLRMTTSRMTVIAQDDHIQDDAMQHMLCLRACVCVCLCACVCVCVCACVKRLWANFLFLFRLIVFC